MIDYVLLALSLWDHSNPIQLKGTIFFFQTLGIKKFRPQSHSFRKEGRNWKMDAGWKNGQGNYTQNFIIERAELNSNFKKTSEISSLKGHNAHWSKFYSRSQRVGRPCRIDRSRCNSDFTAFFLQSWGKFILKVSFFKIRNLKFIEPWCSCRLHERRW